MTDRRVLVGNYVEATGVARVDAKAYVLLQLGGNLAELVELPHGLDAGQVC